MFDGLGVPEQQESVREELAALLTQKNADFAAENIANKLEKEANSDTLEFEFTILSAEKGGGMACEGDKNVWFKFDTDPDTVLGNVKKAIYDNEPNTEELLLIDDFYEWVGRSFQDNQKYRLYAVLRKHMFGGKIVKMKLVRVSNFEVIDFSAFGEEHNYQIIIEKSAPNSVYTPPVANELIKIHDATGKSFDAIIAEKHAANDENYKYVQRAYKKKYLYECQIDLYVDFF